MISRSDDLFGEVRVNVGRSRLLVCETVTLVSFQHSEKVASLRQLLGGGSIKNKLLVGSKSQCFLQGQTTCDEPINEAPYCILYAALRRCKWFWVINWITGNRAIVLSFIRSKSNTLPLFVNYDFAPYETGPQLWISRNWAHLPTRRLSIRFIWTSQHRWTKKS